MYIRLENISCYIQTDSEKKAILDNINLNIEKGDFISIIGTNGAGKSTLLNAIAGNIQIDSGKILLNNEDISKTSDYIRSKYISRVFQNPLDGSAPRMSVKENLSIANKRGNSPKLKFAIKKEDNIKFKELLKSLDLGLEDRLESEMGLLSGGQRQAISLLMATMNNPKLILLDEHSAALDPKTQVKIMEITNKKILENNLSALMITHNIDDALKYGNRLILMHNGKIYKEFNENEKKTLTKKEIFDIFSNL